MEDPVDKQTTISTLDEDIAHITNRLYSITEHLRSSVYGEAPKADEDNDKTALSSPSLASLSTRIGFIKEELSAIEKLVNVLHK